MIPLLIPIRGIRSSMSRLRRHVDDKIIDTLVQDLLTRTLKAVPEKFQTVILTSDKMLAESLEHHTILDNGDSLNQAVRDAVQILDVDRVALIMPDLPGISPDVFCKILRVQRLFDQYIVPTYDKGTAFAILHAELWQKGLLGKLSSKRIIEVADQQGDNIATHIIHEIGRDIDTLEDYNYWINRM